MVEKSNSVWPAALFISALLIVGFLVTGFTINTAIKDNAKTSNVDLKPLTDAISVTNGKIDSLITSLTPTAGEVTGVVATESDAEEEKALALATEFVNSKDFKKIATLTLVNHLSSDIEDYKDISKIEILETSVDCESSDCEVVFEKVKVYYEAADDEKATFKNFVVIVNNVDYDEQFEDAEVKDYSTSKGIFDNDMDYTGFDVISTED
jgi:hypothetical protein